MNRTEIDSLPCEANAQGSHHIHLARGYSESVVKLLMRIAEKESRDQEEQGQTSIKKKPKRKEK